MAAVITRDLSITYGTLTIGGSTEYYILGDWTHEVDYGAASLSCRVVVQADAEAAMQSAVDTLEDGARQIDVDLTLSYGGATPHISYSQSGNTGMLSRASAKVVPNVQQTKLIRVYDLEFSVTMPADESGAGGLRQYSVSAREGSNGLALYRMVGEYTATTAGTASANYANGTTGGAAVLKSITDALAGTFEEVSNTFEHDRRNKVLTFAVERAEIGYRQAVGTTDVASIKNQNLTVDRRKTAPGDVSDARRLVELDVSFSCDVDADETTDLESLWDSTIRPNVIETVRTIAGTAVALVDERPRFDKAGNRVGASMSFLALGDSTILRHSISTTDDDEHGIRFVPVHDGNRFAKLRFDGPARRFRIVTEDVLRFGGATSTSTTAGGGGFAGQDTFGVGVVAPGGAGSFGGSVGSFGGSIFGSAGTVGDDFQAGVEVTRPGSGSTSGGGGVPVQPGYVELRRILRSQPMRIGFPEAGFDVVMQTTTAISEYVEPPSAAAADSGGGDAGEGSTSTGGRGISTPRFPGDS